MVQWSSGSSLALRQGLAHLMQLMRLHAGPVQALTPCELRSAVQTCRGCDLYRRATQSVMGEQPGMSKISKGTRSWALEATSCAER